MSYRCDNHINESIPGNADYVLGYEIIDPTIPHNCGPEAAFVHVVANAHTTPKALVVSPDDREWADIAEKEGVKNKATNTLPVSMLVSTLDNTMRYKMSHPPSLCMMRATIYPLRLSAQNPLVLLWNIDHLQPDGVCATRL